MEELTKSDAKNRMCGNNLKRTAPDFSAGIVVRIDFPAVEKLPQEIWTQADGRHDEQQANAKPDPAGDSTSCPSGCNNDQRRSGECCAPRRCFDNSEKQ